MCVKIEFNFQFFLFKYLINEVLLLDFISFGSLTTNRENEEELTLNQIVQNFRKANDFEEKLNATVIFVKL